MESSGRDLDVSAGSRIFTYLDRSGFEARLIPFDDEIHAVPRIDTRLVPASHLSFGS